jgi:hypothetical protein
MGNGIKFYKGLYGTGKERKLPGDSRSIVFNEDEGILYVNGKGYGGTTEVTFKDDVLSIEYKDGRKGVEINLKDTDDRLSELERRIELVDEVLSSDSDPVSIITVGGVPVVATLSFYWEEYN